MKKFTIILTILMLYSINSLATVRYDVINETYRDIVVEVRGAGSMVIPPGYKNWIGYDNQNYMYERAFRCRQVRNALQCGVAGTIEAIVYSPNCIVNKGRLNNTITCR